MTAYDPQTLQPMLRARKVNHTLDASFYTSPEVFAADLDVIFRRHWIYAGVVADIPEPGDVVALDIGPMPVIILRDDDNQIRAFHNVCRHRGARVVQTPTANVGTLVCGYHSWTYSLTGDLIHASHMGKEFDRSCRGLKPIHVRNQAGLIFLCMAETPPDDIDLMMADMIPYIQPHQLENTKIAFQEDIIEEGNWKLTMENNRECYHCAANHPELVIPLFAHSFGYSPDEASEDDRAAGARYDRMNADAQARWQAAGLPSALIQHLSGRATGFRTERVVLDGAGEAHTLTTRRACNRLLGDFTTADHGALHYWTQPNSWHHFMSDHVVTFMVLPLSPDRTLLRTKWLVHKDAVEGVDYDLKTLTEVWRATNLQDSHLVGIAQAGAESPAYEPGPYSPYTEMLVEEFQRWYIERMRLHLDPAPAERPALSLVGAA